MTVSENLAQIEYPQISEDMCQFEDVAVIEIDITELLLNDNSLTHSSAGH